ncbi:prephenate dehydrogenase [Pelotomaculum thermopropionicum SI]|uniref:Prephenate dehydrogenase n=1 Tax=Pelotomaculum thermopropionicum (strain DSM 13744 / JCM 10971 / SI) TaxID=370438 RepID=A5D1S0_PELTS|nr:prephenate dehydrogenase [Pelotomaculum thermopropionicum SI]
MSPEFNRVAIVGVGLIGGSLGMAICARGLAREVVGTGSRLENLRLAVEMGAVHYFKEKPADGVAGADLVIIATPVSVTIPVLKEILPHLSPGSVITDVGSVKAGIVYQAEELVCSGISFVGGHPMAGSERSGVAGADPYLFENAYYLITPTARTGAHALEAVKRLVAGIGAKVIEMDPDRHDLAVAAVSHLPHFLAAVLVNTISQMPESNEILPLAAGGFRDTTRIAAGNPAMWRDIFMANRERLLHMIRRFRTELDLFESAIAHDQTGYVLSKLEEARRVRSGLPARSKGYLPCLFEIVAAIPDQPGALARLTAHLAGAGINITDIEILRVREGEGGTVRVGFATESEQEGSYRLLKEKGYTVRKR